MLLIGTPSARFWQFHSKITPAWTRELQLNLILIFSNLCRTVSGQVNVFCARLENGASVLGNRLTGENSGTSFVCRSFRFSAIEWRRVIARQFNYVRWNLFLVIFPAQDIQMMFSWNVRWKLIIRSSANLWVKIGVVFDLPFWIRRRGSLTWGATNHKCPICGNQWIKRNCHATKTHWPSHAHKHGTCESVCNQLARNRSKHQSTPSSGVRWRNANKDRANLQCRECVSMKWQSRPTTIAFIGTSTFLFACPFNAANWSGPTTSFAECLAFDCWIYGLYRH